MNGLGDQDLARRRRLLEPRRDVGRVSDGGVVHTEIAADATDDHEPGVEPFSDIEGDATLPAQFVAIVRDRGADAHRREHRALRVVFVGDRRAEQGHDAVTQELIYRAFVAMDLGEHELERAAHDRVDVLGIEARRHRREPRNVDEKHRDLLAFALKRGPRLKDRLGEMAWSVAVRRCKAGCARSGSEGGTAPTAVFVRRRIALATRRTGHDQGGTALAAEPRRGRVFMAAARALHLATPNMTAHRRRRLQ